MGTTNEQTRLTKLWELWEAGKIDSPLAELMTYQAEINNGGHDQYFLNVGNKGSLSEETAALESVLSAKLKRNLKKAHKAYLALEEDEDDEKAEETLEQCDDVFYENEEDINRILREYAEKLEL